MLGRHPEVAEPERDDVAGEALAIARDGVDGARRQFAQHRQPFDEFGEFLEVLVQEAVEFGAVGEGNDQPRLARVEIPQVVQLADVFLPLPLNGRVGDFQQFVGGLPHGGNHHYRTARFAGAHNAGNARDGGGALYRAAAELHDDHSPSIPSEYISSAFSTAAPAAPRMVLWLSTTNL